MCGGDGPTAIPSLEAKDGARSADRASLQSHGTPRKSGGVIPEPPPSSRVACSSADIIAIASSAFLPQNSGSAWKRTQMAGRSGRPKRAQSPSAVSWTQRTPAGLPPGIPGMGDEIDTAMQQAPQPGRQPMRAGPSPDETGEAG